MRIFISYASDDRASAEPIAHALRARGHSVFLDRNDLPPGGTFEDRIERAIKRSGLMVFLVSPSSVEKGRFTRTELKIAERKWPSPKGRLLPVMVRPTPIANIPSYVTAVTILEPEGSITAEAAAAADRLARAHRSWALPSIGGAVVLAAVGYGAWTQFGPPLGGVSVTASEPRLMSKGFFGQGDTHGLALEAVNEGTTARRFLDLSLESTPVGAVSLRDPVDGGGDPNLALIDPLIGETLAPGARLSRDLAVLYQPGAASADQGVTWRVCLHPAQGDKICSAEALWPEAPTEPSAFNVPDALVSDARLVAAAGAGSGFIVAAHNPSSSAPSRIVRLSEDGAAAAQAALAGEPLALSSSPLGLFVGVAPNRLLRLDPDSLETMAEREIVLPGDLAGTFGEPVSTRPERLAQDGKRLWLITGGGAGAAGLAHTPPDLSAFTVPDYYSDVSFDLKGMRMSDGRDAIWTGDFGSTPASIHRLSVAENTEWGGHDFDIASCASAVLAFGDSLFVPDCQGIVRRVLPQAGALGIAERIGSIYGDHVTENTWEQARFNGAGDGAILSAVSVRTSPVRAEPETWDAIVRVLRPGGEEKTLLVVRNTQIASAAATSAHALIVLRNPAGRHELVAAPMP